MSESYRFVRAIVDCGDLRWEYQIDVDGAPQGGMAHDEDVSDWTEDDIRSCTRSMLDCPDDQEIEIVYA
jgi:hypothetical protein